MWIAWSTGEWIRASKTDRKKTCRKLVITVWGRASTVENRKRIHLCGCTSQLLISLRVLWPSCDESYGCSKACWDRMVKRFGSGVQTPWWFHSHPSGKLGGRLSSTVVILPLSFFKTRNLWKSVVVLQKSITEARWTGDRQHQLW